MRSQTNEGNIEAIYALSGLQQGILFHSLSSADPGLYVNQLTVRLVGDLNLEAFRSAWQRLVHERDVLRTAFAWEGSAEPCQVVGKNTHVDLEVEDWRDIPRNQCEIRIREYVREDRRRGFYLTKAPLMRLALIKTEELVHYFVWTSHHIILDGWSVSLLVQEVLQWYEQLQRGEKIRVAARRPYRDYIAWLLAQDLKGAEDFWRRKLKGAQTPTKLLVAGPSSPAEARHGGARHSLTRALTENLQSLAKKCQITMNTLLCGAWAIIFSRYSDQNDVLFGTILSGRPPDLSGAESMIGLFINTLPVRVKVDRNQTLSQWLRRLQGELLELRQYEHTPLVQVQGWSEASRGESLFDTLLVFENYPADDSLRRYKGSLRVEEVIPEEQHHYPLAVIAVPGEEMQLVASYNTGRFDQSTIGIILERTAGLLEAMSASVDRRVCDLTILGRAEQRQLLTTWNQIRIDEERHQLTVHQLFESEVNRRPDAIATVYCEQHLSYLELNRRANHLAHSLRRLGVGAETLIGLCVERSLEMVVGVVGILKAGGAYVPIDPNYPQERIAFLLEDSRPRALVSDEASRNKLGSFEIDVITLDGSAPLDEDDTNPAGRPALSNAAYVIYTSGSTGRPKGAVISHRNIVRLFQIGTSGFNFGGEDVWTLFHSLSFDFSVWELWGALAFGGKLIVAPYWISRSPERFHELLVTEQVTVLNQTPSAFRQLVQTIEIMPKRSAVALRWVIFGGEALSPDSCRRWFDLYGDRQPQLINMYGITETTVHVTYCRLRAGEFIEAGSTPVGRPLPDLCVYILDRHRDLTAIGVAGEVYVAGAGLGRGYLARPDLTAARFVPDHLDASPGRRLYKTGDLARYTADGRLHYLGRADNQVKIRGFRVEPGEVESALRAHPSVLDAVVVARDAGPGQKQLLAYVVADREFAGHQLRQFLSEKLPEWMTPSAFVTLDALPLTPHGKLDYAALPDPKAAGQVAANFASPRNPIEEIMAGIWAEVLGLDSEQVGIHDNFFDLGGHSLLATQIISRTRAHFRVEAPFRDLFDSPTVAGFAKKVEAFLGARTGLRVGELAEISRSGSIPLSFAQSRLWFLDQLHPNSSVYNVPVAVRLVGALNVQALRKSLNEILRRHEALRTIFRAHDGVPEQVILEPQALPLVLLDLTGLPRAVNQTEAMALAGEALRRPFDLSKGLLVRALLLCLESEEYILAIAIHHIVTDRWSMGIIANDFATLCGAYSSGLIARLPEPPIQYAEFALWQRRHMKGELLDTLLSYWERQLGDSSFKLNLPLDSPRPSSPSYRGATEWVRLSTDHAGKIMSVSRREGVTLFMYLTAAFTALLRYWSGEEDIVIGTPVAGRSRLEAEHVVGFFVNQIAVRVNLSGDPTFRELLRRVRETAVDAYAHQDLPFDKLAERLRLERDGSRSLIFQVKLEVDHDIKLQSPPGLAITPCEVDMGVSRHDLHLRVVRATDKFYGALTYNSDIFFSGTIQRLLIGLRNLLEIVTANPQLRLSEIDLMLTAAARRQERHAAQSLRSKGQEKLKQARRTGMLPKISD